jgi:hypothetical protein
VIDSEKGKNETKLTNADQFEQEFRCFLGANGTTNIEIKLCPF